MIRDKMDTQQEIIDIIFYLTSNDIEEQRLSCINNTWLLISLQQISHQDISRINQQIEYLGYQVLQDIPLETNVPSEYINKHLLQIGKSGQYQQIHDLVYDNDLSIRRRKVFKGKKYLSCLDISHWISHDEIFSSEMEDPIVFYAEILPDFYLNAEQWKNIYVLDLQAE